MIIKAPVFTDERGTFCELLNMEKAPWNSMNFVQLNVVTNKPNVWRGLHYQYECQQGKLITVLAGEVYDYIVDLRLRSGNFGKVQKFHLTAKSGDMLWVPPWYAHGYLALTPNTKFLYAIFGEGYNKDDEYTITPYDFPQIKSDLNSKVIMSVKDKSGLKFKDAPIYE